MIKMMKMLPLWLSDRIKPPMIAKNRLQIWQSNSSRIAVNLTNLLICSDYCLPCPSKPDTSKGAVFCATGKSDIPVMKQGCNCIECPLIEKCGREDRRAYFCIHGICTGKPTTGTALIEKSASAVTAADQYLQRFITGVDSPRDENGERNADVPEKDVKDVTLNFIGDKELTSRSNLTILESALKNGISHTHVCGGNARCSTCRVMILLGGNNIPTRNEKEKKLAEAKGFTNEVRLACQAKPFGDIELRRLVYDDEDISEAIDEGRNTLTEAGREENVTIMFADIRSFTNFSEKNLPYDIIHILNRYFNTIGRSIDENGGYIDKYMGDGIMVIFGLEKDLNNDHDHATTLAIDAGLKMLEALDEFNTYLTKHFQYEFKIGIGIHSGNAIIGNLGFYKKMELTAIGDTVNTASRIESLNKRLNTTILVSETAYIETRDEFEWGASYRARVKGKEEIIKVYIPLRKK